MTTSTSTLLTPIQVGSVEVRNRIVSTAHGAFTDFFDPRDSGDRYIAYQQRRAAGGCGMIILQAMHVHPTSAQGQLHPMPLANDIRPKHARLAAAVAPHGTTLVQQLFHFGALGLSNESDDYLPRWSFSGTTTPEGEASHEMTAAEIEEVLHAFVAAAVNTVEAGLHGVELHATHGYLLQQSFSPFGNQRTDEWGEPLRFATELIDRVRAAVGRDAIVGLRISAEDWLPTSQGGLGPEGLADVAATLVARGGLDYLNHSEGSTRAHYARSIGSFRHPHGEWLPLTAGLRSAIDAAIPVIGVGRITTVELAERALRDGVCDLVGMTRAHIADPDVVARIAAGQAEQIRPCVGANVCIDGRPVGIRCFHNPEVGHEYRQDAGPPVVHPSRVLVVGGGPAGLKAAEVAATRGHDVILVEQADHLGGRLGLVGGLGKAAEMLGAVAWLEWAAQRAGAELRTGTAMDAATLAEFGADAIVLATGALPRIDRLCTSDGTVRVVSVDAAAKAAADLAESDLGGRRVLVADQVGHIDVALVVEALAGHCELSIMTPAAVFGPRVGFTHMADMLPGLHRRGVTFLNNRALVSLEDGKVRSRDVHTGDEHIDAWDVVVAGIHPVPVLDLRAAAARAAREVHVVGDANAPRGVPHAIFEGHRAGQLIGTDPTGS